MKRYNRLRYADTSYNFVPRGKMKNAAKGSLRKNEKLKTPVNETFYIDILMNAFPAKAIRYLISNT
jgi:hypothetical protein